MNRINWEDWNGAQLLAAVQNRDRRFPEFEYCLTEAGDLLPHENPWHLEPILEHTCWVIDTTRDLSARYHLSAANHVVAMAAATWHDAGKPFTRAPKEKFICVKCGRPFNDDTECPCGGATEHRIVMGYHDHEQVGASKWVFGNIAKRERIPYDFRYPIRRIIKDHLWFSDRVISGSIPHNTNLPKILVSWADEVSRRKAPFDAVDFNPIFQEVADKFISKK